MSAFDDMLCMVAYPFLILLHLIALQLEAMGQSWS